MNESEDFFESDHTDEEPTPQEERMQKIFESLRLNHLNEE